MGIEAAMSMQHALPISAVENVLACLDRAGRNQLTKVDRCWRHFMSGDREGSQFHLVGGYHPSLVPVEFTKSREWSLQENSSMSERFPGVKIVPCPYVCSFTTSLDFTAVKWLPEDTFRQRFVNRVKLNSDEQFLCKQLVAPSPVLLTDLLQRISAYLVPATEITSLRRVSSCLSENIDGRTLSIPLDGVYIPPLMPSACREQLEARNSTEKPLTLRELNWIKKLHAHYGVPFASWPEIHHLNLAETNIDDATLEEILHLLPNLTTLSLRQCKKITTLTPLIGLDFLYALNCADCSLIADLTPLSGLLAMKCLDIGRCQLITNLEPLSKLTSLERLGLSGTKITSLEPLAELVLLKRLMLDNCWEISSNELAYLANLSVLEILSTNIAVTDVGLNYLGGLPSLRMLSLYNCSNITDAGLHHLVRLDRLIFLILEDAINLTDVGLKHLTSLKLLERLELYDCLRITDASLMRLIILPKLRELILPRGTQIANAGIVHVRFGSTLRVHFI